MPYINRIRLSNIRYDMGARLIPDIIFESEDLNMITLMLNGEGKTTIIQLIIQTVLPNQSLQGRHLRDTIQPGSTGHVVVEWRMDGDEERYVCTGFCFHLDKNMNYSVFNYVWDYMPMGSLFGEEELQDLISLPLAPKAFRDRPIGYQEYRDWLLDHNIRPFTEFYKYKDKIREYRIVPEEWRFIAEMNNDEAGASGIFAKAKTTINLLDQLLIPQMEKMIYDSEEKASRIISMFTKHQEVLLDIPIQRRNIKSLGIIIEESGSLLSEIKRYDEQSKRYADQVVVYHRMWKRFVEMDHEKQLKAESLHDQVFQLNIKIEDLKWKLASYPVFERTQAKEAADQKEQEEKRKLDVEVLRWEETRLQLRKLRSFAEYQEAKKREIECIDVENEIRLLDLSEPELLEQVKEASHSFGASWNYRFLEVNETKAQEESLRGQKQQEAALLKTSVEKKREEDQQLTVAVTQLQSWLDRMEQDRQTMLALWGEASSDHPEEELETFRCEYALTHKTIEEKREEKAHLQREHDESAEQMEKEKDGSLQALQTEEKETLDRLAEDHQCTVTLQWKNRQRDILALKEKANLMLEQVKKRQQGKLDNWRAEFIKHEQTERESTEITLDLVRQEKEKTVRERSESVRVQVSSYRQEKERLTEEANLLIRESEIKQAETERLRTFTLQQEEEAQTFAALVPPEEIYDAQKRLLDEYQAAIEQAEIRRAQVRVEINEFKDRLDHLQQTDYFVPHRDLEKLQTHIKQNGIPVMLGNEWIAMQEMTEIEKEGLLEHYPLLPYSLLVSENHLSAVESVLLQLGQLVSEIPVLIATFESLSSKPEAAHSPVGVKRVSTQGLFVFQGASAEVFISADYIEQLKKQLAEQIAEGDQEENRLSDHIKSLGDLLNRLRAFYTKFPFEDYTNAKSYLPSLWGQIKQLKKQIEKASETAKELEQQMDAVETALKQQMEQVEQRAAKDLEDLAKQLRQTLEELEADLKLRETDVLRWGESRIRTISSIRDAIEVSLQAAFQKQMDEQINRYEAEKSTVRAQVELRGSGIMDNYEKERTELRNRFEEQQRRFERDLSILSTEEKRLSSQVTDLERYLVNFQKWNNKKEEYRKGIMSLSQVRTEINEKSAFLETRGSEINDLNLSLQRLETKIEVLQFDLLDYELIIQGIQPNGELDYESEKRNLKRVREALQEKQSSRDALEKQRGLLLENIENAVKRLVGHGIYSSRAEMDHLPEIDISVAEEMIQEADHAFQQQGVKKDKQDQEHRDAEKQAVAAKSSWEDAWKTYSDQHLDQEPFGYEPFEHKKDAEAYKVELKSLGVQMKVSTQTLLDLEAELSDLQDTIMRMQKVSFYKPTFKGESLTVEEWATVGQSPRDAFDSQKENIEKSQKELDQGERKVLGAYNNFKQKLAQAENDQVRAFVNRLNVQDNMVLDYELMSAHFETIQKALEAKKVQIEFNQQESNRTKEQIADYCLEKAMDIYKNIKELSRNSKIDLYGKEVEMVTIDWPATEEPAQAIRKHLDEVLEVAQTKEEPEKRRRYIEESLDTRNLVHQIAPLSSCKVMAFKPRKEGIVAVRGTEYAPWDKVHNWSGGEQYAIYLTMFMVMVNHVRKQADGKYNVFKTIVADNPFGKASSGHILKPIFEIAKKNQVKLICFTAHKADEILRNFPTGYSLKGINVYGKDVISSTPLHQVEAGFVKK